jgi:methionine-rich copper-binding protein CopC
MPSQQLRACILVAALTGLAGTPASARQMHMVESFPAGSAVVSGDRAQYFVRFDGPVDHQQSRIWISQGGNVLQLLVPRLNSAPSTLYALARRLPPGDYEMHWEVRSLPDGEITTGSVPFKISG